MGVCLAASSSTDPNNKKSRNDDSDDDESEDLFAFAARKSKELFESAKELISGNERHDRPGGPRVGVIPDKIELPIRPAPQQPLQEVRITNIDNDHPGEDRATMERRRREQEAKQAEHEAVLAQQRKAAEQRKEKEFQMEREHEKEKEFLLEDEADYREEVGDDEEWRRDALQAEYEHHTRRILNGQESEKEQHELRMKMKFGEMEEKETSERENLETQFFQRWNGMMANLSATGNRLKQKDVTAKREREEAARRQQAAQRRQAEEVEKRKKAEEAKEEVNTISFKDGKPPSNTETKDLFDNIAVKFIKYDYADGTTKYTFQNTTNEYEANVHCEFGANSELEALGTAKLTKGANGWLVFEDVIYPNSHAGLMQGKIKGGWKCSYGAGGVSQAYKDKIKKEWKAKTDSEINAVKKLKRGEDINETLKACVENGTPYVDLEFPPAHQSLGKGKSAVGWARPEWYLKPEETPVLFKDRVEPNDIDQGGLGDCWFVCSVAATAEFPEQIKKIYCHSASYDQISEERRLGAYRVTLNKHGWWNPTIVDSYLPSTGGRPEFVRNAQEPEELWVSLLEKAYAKLHGSYAAIVGGNAAHGLQDLTGFPSRRFDDEFLDPKQQEALWQKLLRYDQAGYLMSASPATENEKGRHEELGLATGHAYSLLRVIEFPKKNLRLVQIRNPWGTGKEWTGDWSDKSDKWKQNPDVAQGTDFIDEEDGCFWMTWQDCCKYFGNGCVCYRKVGWYDYRISNPISKGWAEGEIELKCAMPVNALIMVSQRDKRADPNAKNLALSLEIAEKSSKDGRLKTVAYGSRDAEEPATSCCYLYGRDVSMFYRFAPRHGISSFVIQLKDYDNNNNNVPIVVTLLTEVPVSGGFEVKFHKSQSNADSPVQLQYQVMDNGIVEEFKDTHIH